MPTNEIMLKKALALLPKLNKEKIDVARTVIVKKENGNIRISDDVCYREKELSAGDQLCVDFGDHQVGTVKISLKSVGSHFDAPAWIRLKFAERSCELFENIEDYHGWISSSWVQQEQLHIDVFPAVVDIPRRFAFRYLQIEILAVSNKYRVVVDNIECTAVSSADNKKLKEYKTDDQEFKRLDKIACRTLHNCMQTVFEDGPKRDRRLWMGDLRLQALANYQTYAQNDMVKGCLYLFAALTNDDGRIGACVFLEPEPEVDDTFMFDYSLLFIPALLDYFKETGDKETLSELFPTCVRQIEIARENFGKDGVVNDSDVLGWCFIDWNLSLNKQASAQGVYLYSLKAAAEIAETLGDKSLASKLLDEYSEKAKAANKFFWDEEKQFYTSGADKQISWASQIWLILGGAAGERAVSLLERLPGYSEAVEPVTPYMYHHYIEALIMCGKKDLAAEVMRGYWGGMADSDTFGELYNPRNPNESPYGSTIVNSYCHAWSCGPAYFLRKYF